MQHSDHSRHHPRRNASWTMAAAVLAAIIVTGCAATPLAPGPRSRVDTATRRSDDVPAITYHDLFAAPVRLGLDNRAAQ